jgi:hypothetical protein
MIHKVLSGKIITGKKVRTVNASDVKWVECEHVNKTKTILQLETQIHQLKCKLESPLKTKETDAHKLQSNLDKLKMNLSTEMKDCKFKLEPESFLTKIAVIKFHTSV